MRNNIIITLFLMAIISFTACKKGQKQTELIHIPGIVENINLQMIFQSRYLLQASCYHLKKLSCNIGKKT